MHAESTSGLIIAATGKVPTHIKKFVHEEEEKARKEMEERRRRANQVALRVYYGVRRWFRCDIASIVLKRNKL